MIDGPNVAYYHQNFVDGAFNYRQIEAVVQHLLAQGKRVLLILPDKYTRREVPNHTCSPERSTTLSDADLSLLHRWRHEGVLYVCPNKIYDDWLWMYASVASEVATHRTAVVTNDAMRDHWCEMLRSRLPPLIIALSSLSSLHHFPRPLSPLIALRSFPPSLYLFPLDHSPLPTLLCLQVGASPEAGVQPVAPITDCKVRLYL